jgi:predicted nucleic acid-binding protein
VRAVADRLVLDTNVLLAATDEGRVEHDRARAALDEWPSTGTVIYTSGQILREYLAVATRPEQQNGLGLSLRDALANTRAFRSRLRWLDEHGNVAERLEQLLERAPCAGKQVHDANIVATMLVHGVGTIVTINVDDFRRFESEVSVVDLGQT